MFNTKEKQSGKESITHNRKPTGENEQMNRTNDVNPSSMNMISDRSEIIGTLKSRRDIRISGKVDGGVEAEGKVIITSTGHIDGSVTAEEAQIAGHVVGDVHVADKLTLTESAVVESDLYAKILCVKEGAIFNGTCHMNEETPEPEKEDWSSTTAGDNNDYNTDVLSENFSNGDSDEDEENEDKETVEA